MNLREINTRDALRMRRFATITIAVVLTSLLTVGCQPPANNTAQSPANADSHDHGDGHDHAHAETLQEGFAQLSQAYSTIKTAFEANKSDDAHDPLHDVAHLLEGMKELVEKSELSADAKTKANAGVETLFDAFGKIDGMFHGGAKVDFAELDKSIAPAMEELKGLIQ